MSNILKCEIIYEDAYLDITPKSLASVASVIEEAIGECISKKVRKAYILFNDDAVRGNCYRIDMDVIIKKIMKDKEKVNIE